MKPDQQHIRLYIILGAVSALFLILERVTHLEFMFHLAAIPLEVLVAVFLVEMFLESRRVKEKRRQLMLIKSYLFRSDMHCLYTANFNALKSPPVTMDKIKTASLEELKKMRQEATTVEYKSLELMDTAVMEYVNCQQVWQNFMDLAVTYNFPDVFRNMIDVMHFAHDVKEFKDNNPDQIFIHKAAEDPQLMEKVTQVLGDGIRAFLDYAIELKEKEPNMFRSVIENY